MSWATAAVKAKAKAKGKAKAKSSARSSNQAADDDEDEPVEEGPITYPRSKAFTRNLSRCNIPTLRMLHSKLSNDELPVKITLYRLLYRIFQALKEDEDREDAIAAYVGAHAEDEESEAEDED